MGNEQAKVVQNKQYPSGNVYSGEMVGNKRHGQGTLTWPDGAKYEGSWVNDLCDGLGHMQFPNGSVYEGNFARNNVYGQGKLTTVNGEVLEGFWEYRGRAEGSTPVGKYNFNGDLVDLKTGQHRPYKGPLAFYLLTGLVSLPNMPDPMESLLPYAVVLMDEGKGSAPALAEQGRVLFQQGLNSGDVQVAQAVQTAPSSSSSVTYGRKDPALQDRHPDDHARFSLLDPRLYLAGLGFPTEPANLNKSKQEAIRQQQQFAGNQSSTAVPIAVPVDMAGNGTQGIPATASTIRPQSVPTPQDRPTQPVVFF